MTRTQVLGVSLLAALGSATGTVLRAPWPVRILVVVLAAAPLVATSISIGLAEVGFAREENLSMTVVWAVAVAIWAAVGATVAVPWRVGRAATRARGGRDGVICPDPAGSGSMGNRA